MRFRRSRSCKRAGRRTDPAIAGRVDRSGRVVDDVVSDPVTSPFNSVRMPFTPSSRSGRVHVVRVAFPLRRTLSIRRPTGHANAAHLSRRPAKSYLMLRSPHFVGRRPKAPRRPFRRVLFPRFECDRAHPARQSADHPRARRNRRTCPLRWNRSRHRV